MIFLISDKNDNFNHFVVIIEIEIGHDLNQFEPIRLLIDSVN